MADKTLTRLPEENRSSEVRFVGPETEAERTEARDFVKGIYYAARDGYERASQEQPIVAKGNVVGYAPDYGAMSSMLDRMLAAGKLLGESAGDVGFKATEIVRAKGAIEVAKIQRDGMVEAAKLAPAAGVGGIGNVERMFVLRMPKTLEAESLERARLQQFYPEPEPEGAVTVVNAESGDAA